MIRDAWRIWIVVSVTWRLFALQLSPVLGTVIDVQDFDGFNFHSIDHNVWERCKRQFSCAATVAGSTQVGCGFEGTNALVNRADGRLGKMRIVLLQVILDAL